ncbi:MAG: radical SAM protein [Dehalococcoidia bacterium]|nr:MAG: radical SAM protein [Dehalococcoidia bacterium]
MTYTTSGNGLGPFTFDIEKLSQCSFEVGPIRPPSEGGSHSLLLRATRNCSWNRCKFCYGMIYNREKFELRSVEDIKKDIDAVRAIADEIKAVSWKLGYGGEVKADVGIAMLRSDPRLRASQSFVLVFDWLHFGGSTVFLQDANTLIMPTHQLLQVVRYLKETFPAIERVTSYARAKTLAKKPLEELKELSSAGLSRLHVGLETGDDELLSYVDKGVTAAEHIDAGKKAKEAGFELSEYVMTDLGGRARWEQHARNTARVLNEINPDFIRLRPLAIGPGLPLYEDYTKGILQLSSPHERLREVKTLVENLHVTGRVCFDHFLNSWYRDSDRRYTLFKQDYNGYRFPEEKARVLQLIEEGLRIDESTHIHVKDLIGIAHL